MSYAYYQSIVIGLTYFDYRLHVYQVLSVNAEEHPGDKLLFYIQSIYMVQR